MPEKSEPKPPVRDTSRVPLEDYKPFDDYEPFPRRVDEGDLTIEEFFGNQNETAFKIIAVVGAVGFIFFVFVVFGIVGTRNKTKETYEIPSTPYRYGTPAPSPPKFIVTTLGNADATSLPQPVVPRGVTIKTPVQISVVVSVDEKGFVYDAQSYDGPEALQKAAVAAAKKARFPVRNGQRSSGILTYDFARSR